MYGQVLVLNADYSLLNAVTWKRALCLVVKGKADVVKDSEVNVGPFFIPQVIRLLKRVNGIYHRRIAWSRQNVYLRDKYTCQYCGQRVRESRLTLDHVLPKSRGGRNSWTNTVTACFPCNNKKGNRTPDEASMPLRRSPFQPTVWEFMLARLKKVEPDLLRKAAF